MNVLSKNAGRGKQMELVKVARIGNKRKWIKGKKLKKKGQHMMVSAMKMSKRRKRRAHMKIKRRRKA